MSGFTLIYRQVCFFIGKIPNGLVFVEVVWRKRCNLVWVRFCTSKIEEREIFFIKSSIWIDFFQRTKYVWHAKNGSIRFVSQVISLRVVEWFYVIFQIWTQPRVLVNRSFWELIWLLMAFTSLIVNLCIPRSLSVSAILRLAFSFVRIFVRLDQSWQCCFAHEILNTCG